MAREDGVHEAFSSSRRDGRELSLELAAEATPGILFRAVVPGPDEVLEQRERLDSLRTLPERQQRMLWLQGLGLSYDDIAARTGCTSRTVERQLLRAKRALREAGARPGGASVKVGEVTTHAFCACKRFSTVGVEPLRVRGGLPVAHNDSFLKFCRSL